MHNEITAGDWYRINRLVIPQLVLEDSFTAHIIRTQCDHSSTTLATGAMFSLQTCEGNNFKPFIKSCKFAFLVKLKYELNT
jgi:hypothetical protein